MQLNIKLPPNCEQVICSFITSKLDEAGANGVVLGLSGGLDSAVVAKLCCDAVGNDKTLALLMPERKETDNHFNDAEDLAKTLKLRYSVIEIEPLINSFLKSTSSLKTNDLALGNLKARIRSNLWYHFANSENLLVVGTGNKSELMVGYFTKYGDGASDIAPIGDLYKTQVRKLAEVLKLPDKIINKPPSAGLVEDQTDEKDLGISYEQLDRLLLGLELRLPFESIAKSLEVEITEIERVANLSYRTRHKRKFPKIPKLGIKTVGTDLRE
jgi:NAD+ synthase